MGVGLVKCHVSTPTLALPLHGGRNSRSNGLSSGLKKRPAAVNNHREGYQGRNWWILQDLEGLYLKPFEHLDPLFQRWMGHEQTLQARTHATGNPEGSHFFR